jgi:WD40 repeat protein
MRHATRLSLVVLLGFISIECTAQTSQSSKLKPIEAKVPDRKDQVSYAREIAEILEDKCVACHSAVLAENRLNLESVAGMVKGGKRGPAVAAGKADESLLFRMAAHRAEPVMPPKDKPASKPLTAEELGLLKLWIDAGAKDDSASESRPRETKTIVLGDLPPGFQPINAVDLTADGARVAAGRPNVVQVYDIDSGLEIVSLGGHKDLIQSLRFSPDGTFLAAGSFRIVTIWAAPTGRMGKTLAAHTAPVQAVAVTPDGTTAYSGGQDKTIRAWSLADGKLLRTMIQPAPITALALSPDGKSLFTGGVDGRVRWIDPTDGREHAASHGHTATVLDLAVIAGSSQVVAVSEDGTGRIWTLPHVADRKTLGNGQSPHSESKSIVLNGHKGPVRAVGVTPDGQTIVTAGDDAVVRIWNVRDGSTRGFLATGHTGPILALALSPDGKLILTGSADKTAKLMILSGGNVIRTFTGHHGSVRSVAFSPLGDRFATADALGCMKVWETTDGRGVIAFGHTARNGTVVQPIQKVTFTDNGGLLSASADSTLKTWAFAGSWAEHKTLDAHGSRVLALDFSPDGKLLATAGGEPTRSGELKLWEVGKGLLARSQDSLHSDTVFAVRFSPDGTKLASAAADKFLKVTGVSDGKLLRSFEGHTHHVMAVDWKSDGKQLVSGGADSVIKVWDFDSGDQLRTLQAVGKQITSVRWNAGKPEVVGASGDAQVRIWNPDNGGVARTFSGPGDFVYSVAASADGTRIAAGGAEGVLFVWNGQNSQVIRKIEPLPVTPPQVGVPRTASAR